MSVTFRSVEPGRDELVLHGAPTGLMVGAVGRMFLQHLQPGNQLQLVAFSEPISSKEVMSCNIEASSEGRQSTLRSQQPSMLLGQELWVTRSSA